MSAIYFSRKQVVLESCIHSFCTDSNKYRFRKSYRKRESLRRRVMVIKPRVIGDLRDPPNYTIYCLIMIRL